MIHLLLVDDDERLANLTRRYLVKNDYNVTVATDPFAALKLMQSVAFDALIVDVMMPEMSGFELSRAVRQSSQVPIILLTARHEPQMRLEGFEAGADDYIPKPFEPRELLLRIEAVMRRNTLAEMPETVQFGGFLFDMQQQKLISANGLIELTRNEKLVLGKLVANVGEAVSRDALRNALADGSDARAVDVQMTRLRKKIETDPKAPRYIETVRGVGYQLNRVASEATG